MLCATSGSEHGDLLTTGEWTPLAAASPDTRVVASRWTDGRRLLRALANRGDAYAGPVGEREVELPARGIAACVGSEQVMVAGGGDPTFPAREAVRVPAPRASAWPRFPTATRRSSRAG